LLIDIHSCFRWRKLPIHAQIDRPRLFVEHSMRCAVEAEATSAPTFQTIESAAVPGKVRASWGMMISSSKQFGDSYLPSTRMRAAVLSGSGGETR
jgi:hypothetical protein